MKTIRNVKSDGKLRINNFAYIEIISKLHKSMDAIKRVPPQPSCSQAVVKRRDTLRRVRKRVLKQAPLTAVLWIGLLAATQGDVITHYVTTNGPGPSPYTSWATAASNIQDAVNVACSNSGDVVWVSNGTYYSNGQVTLGDSAMIVVTNAITLQSVNGPAVTIIDGNFPAYTNRVLAIRASAFVAGFTITNGNGAGQAGAGGVNRGAGVLFNGGNGILSNCVITGNACDRENAAGQFGTYVGAGVFFNSGYGTMIDCLVCGNTTTNSGSGGGVYFYESGPGRLLNCVISNNYNTNQSFAVYANSVGSFFSNCTIIGNQGGGLYLSGTADTCRVIGNNNPGNVQNGNNMGGVSLGGVMRNSWILNNTSARDSGGGYINGASAILSNCVVSGNVSGSGGTGGIYVNMNCRVINCTITSNSTAGNGGGVYYAGRNSVMRNCLISSNNCGASSYGGGVYASVYANSTGTIENCTIVNNYAGSRGGGIYYEDAASGTGTVINTIIVSNQCASGPNWYLNTAKASFIFCCTTPTNNLPGGSNTTNDPAFVDYPNKNYRLLPTSPCANSGLMRDWMSSAVDLDGHPRLDRFSGRPDMGCYELVPAGTMFRVR